MELKSQEKLTNCPALPLIAAAWMELLDKGFVCGSIPVGWDHSALWLEDNGKPVAILTWNFQDWNRDFWINLAYVLPEYRRQGLYGQLHMEAKRLAAEKKASSISSGIGITNEPMRVAAEAMGRKPLYVVYRELLP